ncbi:MAG: hypothetical protein AAB963_01445 [Patescibacteria group bacterium]
MGGPMSFSFDDPVQAAIAIRVTHLTELVIMFRNAFALLGIPTQSIANECEKLEKACRKEGLTEVARRLAMLRESNDSEAGYDLNVMRATGKIPQEIRTDIEEIVVMRDLLIQKVHELAGHK